jgi:hypothetical protein
MRFVVKATSRRGRSLWISRPGIDELRALVPRDRGDVFETEKDAHIAISKMSRVFDGMSYIFSVEVAD